MKFLLKRRSQKGDKKKSFLLTSVKTPAAPVREEVFLHVSDKTSSCPGNDSKEMTPLFGFSKKFFSIKSNTLKGNKDDSESPKSEEYHPNSSSAIKTNENHSLSFQNVASLSSDEMCPRKSTANNLIRSELSSFLRSPSSIFSKKSYPVSPMASTPKYNDGDVPKQNKKLADMDQLPSSRCSSYKPSKVPTSEAPQSHDTALESGKGSGAETLDSRNDFTLTKDLLNLEMKDHLDLLPQWIEACCEIFSFDVNDAEIEVKKKTKEKILSQLIELVKCPEFVFTEELIGQMMHMISTNIFRPLSAPLERFVYITSLADTEETELRLENSWPHLHLVYELLLQSLISSTLDVKYLKVYIDNKFVMKLLNLFSCEDPRERDYLKTILHRIYGRIMSLRGFIRKSIHYKFMLFLDQEDSHRGISELLEILASIISGFARPLKEEHKMFLKTSLLPLHKACSLGSFNQELTYCLAQYVERDCSLVVTIISGLLHYWPVTNTSKEVLFLSEIEELLEYTQAHDFSLMMIPLFRQLALCIESPHFQVAERVLFLWNNEYILDLINLHREKLYPIIISALYRNSENHWNSAVHSLTFNVMKVLSSMDSKLYEECSEKYCHPQVLTDNQRNDRQKMWEMLKKNYPR